jgi:putative transcriptional regulator
MESKLDSAEHVKHAFHVKNRVLELRTVAGLSQAELGKVLGVSRQTINSIENGRYLPSLPLALAIARNFDASVEDIFIPEGD